MAKGPEAPVTPEVLRWARQRCGLGAAEAAERLGVGGDRLDAWERGEARPTVAQLRKIAALYRQTLASFFLPTVPPETATLPPDFRGAAERVPSSVVREVRRAEERTDAFTELSGRPTRVRLPSVSGLAGNTEAVAADLRARLGIGIREQFRAQSAQAYLSDLIDRFENIGVLVFHMSRVPIDDCRGFSFIRNRTPVVTLNGADSAGTRAFTLLHEVGHLLGRTGGLCGLWNDEQAEQTCNQFAGDFLMPVPYFDEEALAAWDAEPIRTLSALFKVSQSAVAVRMRQRGMLSDRELGQRLASAREIAAAARDAAKAKPGGPPFHRIQLRNLGRPYVSAVFDAMGTSEITLTDASYLLGAKVSTIDRMEAELSSRPEVISG